MPKKSLPNLIKLRFLELRLYAKDKYIWGKPRSERWSVDLILQDHFGTRFLEPGGPDLNRNHVVLIESNLFIFNSPSEAIDISRCNIVIAISALGCLVYVLQLKID